jgi:hypothetical protein
MSGRLSAWIVIVSAAALSACGRGVSSVHPPDQFAMPGGLDPQPEVRLITMNGIDAKLAVLAGVDGAGTGEERKWTADKARFRFRVGSFGHRDFYMRYSVHPVTFQQTGPVRLSIAVNGVAFDSFRKDAPGDFEYRRAADDIGIPPYQPFEISIAVDPPYVAPDDGAKMGILLTSIGFLDRTTEPSRP